MLRTFVLVRIGLVAAIVDAFVWTLFISSPMTLQSSAWYAGAGDASLATSERWPFTDSKRHSRGARF